MLVFWEFFLDNVSEGEIPAETSTSAELIADNFSPIEFGGTVNKDSITRIEFVETVQSYAAAPSDLALNIKPDYLSPIEFGLSVKSNNVIPTQTGLTIKNDLIELVNTTQTSLSNSANVLEFGLTVNANNFVPIDFGTTKNSDSRLNLQSGSTLQIQGIAPVEIGLAVTLDKFSSAEFAETILSVLTPLIQILSSINRDNIVSTAHALTPTSDSGIPIEFVAAQAVQFSDAQIYIEYAPKIQSDSKNLFEISLISDSYGSFPISFGLIQRENIPSPVDFSRTATGSSNTLIESSLSAISDAGLPTTWLQNFSFDRVIHIETNLAIKNNAILEDDPSLNQRLDVGIYLEYNVTGRFDNAIQIAWSSTSSSQDQVKEETGLLTQLDKPVRQEMSLSALSVSVKPLQIQGQGASDSMLPVEFQGTVYLTEDSTGPITWSGTLTNSNLIPTETGLIIQFDRPVRQETSLTALSVSVIPLQVQGSANSNSTLLVEFQGTNYLILDSNIPTDWLSSLVTDSRAAQEFGLSQTALSIPRIDDSVRVQGETFQLSEINLAVNEDGVTPIEFTGVIFINSDAFIPVDWSKITNADTVLNTDTSLFQSLDYLLPNESGLLAFGTAFVPLEHTSLVAGNSTVPIEFIGLVFVVVSSSDIPLEFSANQDADAVAQIEALEKIIQDYIMLPLGGVVRLVARSRLIGTEIISRLTATKIINQLTGTKIIDSLRGTKKTDQLRGTDTTDNLEGEIDE